MAEERFQFATDQVRQGCVAPGFAGRQQRLEEVGLRRDCYAVCL